MQFLLLEWPGEGGNHFTGSLYLYKPKSILINYNWISDIQISDTSQLSTCDVSYNPLLGNLQLNTIQTSLNSVGKACITEGLYAASLLANTASSKLPSTPTSTTKGKKSSEMKILSTRVATATTNISGTLTYDSFFPAVSILHSIGYLSYVASAIESIDILKNTTMQESTSLPAAIMASTTTQQSDTSLPAAPSNQQGNNTNPGISQWVLIALFGGFVGLCILTFVASKIFKHPKIHSKFGRKNSFGTLNTMNTVKTTK